MSERIYDILRERERERFVKPKRSCWYISKYESYIWKAIGKKHPNGYQFFFF